MNAMIVIIVFLTGRKQKFSRHRENALLNGKNKELILAKELLKKMKRG
jgi:hypothetical protein